MSRDLSVSNEMLTVNTARTLGPELQVIVERLMTSLRSPANTWDDNDLIAIEKLVKARTGMIIKKTRLSIRDTANAMVMVPVIEGHAGNAYLGQATKPKEFFNGEITKAIFETTIDLDNARVKGPLTKLLTFDLYFNIGLFTGPTEFTAEEITAVILHEIGHMFSVFMTLGDYVWLNYFLSDGVQVLLGKKPNVYKLQILTRQTLAESISDPKEREALLKEPTEANLRRAVLTAFRKRPRHYLTSTETNNSLRRDEQLADNFVSRMGYGRALVTGQAKRDRAFGSRYLGSRSSFLMAESLKILATVIEVLALPIGGFSMAWMVSVKNLWEDTSNPRINDYDNPTERIQKIRRDLIAQLKVSQHDAALRETLTADIQVIDRLLSNYHQHRTLWETLGQVFSTERRRQWQLKKQEEVLENLMHNDLFVITQRFDQLNNTRA